MRYRFIYLYKIYVTYHNYSCDEYVSDIILHIGVCLKCVEYVNITELYLHLNEK